MKKKIYTICIMSLMMLTNLFAQQDYQMRLANAEKIGNDTFEFDVLLRSTGSDFTLTSYQVALEFNEGIQNGSEIQFAYIASTSELNNIPQNAIGCDTSDGCAKLTFVSLAGTDNISSTEIKVGRFQMTSATGFGNVSPDVVWSFNGNVNTILTDNTWQSFTDSTKHIDLDYQDPLPVELTSFSGAQVNSQIVLAWETATEINNLGFEVHRSVDKNDWELVSFVEGQGTKSTTTKYSFSDDSYSGGNKYFYRLKQLDTDGTYEFTDIIEIALGPIEFNLKQNYPNPFNPSTTINFSIQVQGQVSLIVYNMLGQIVKELVNNEMEAGTHKIDFDATGLTSGAYIYALNVDGKYSAVKKMLLLK